MSVSPLPPLSRGSPPCLDSVRPSLGVFLGRYPAIATRQGVESTVHGASKCLLARTVASYPPHDPHVCMGSTPSDATCPPKARHLYPVAVRRFGPEACVAGSSETFPTLLRPPNPGSLHPTVLYYTPTAAACFWRVVGVPESLRRQKGPGGGERSSGLIPQDFVFRASSKKEYLTTPHQSLP